VTKGDIIPTVIAHLRDLLAAGSKAARATTAAATDPDSKAENKYDTRNLEASYLARGQAFRVAETMEALQEFESLAPKTFAPGEAISEGALVSLTGTDGTYHYFLGPAAGGTEVVIAGTPVTILTPASPLGAKLMRRRTGDQFELHPGRPASSVKITAVQ
jgi:hypothetical protein